MDSVVTKAKWMDEELEMLKDASSKFFETECAPNLEAWEEQGHVDRKIWNKLGEAGFLNASIPVEYGGAGGNFAHEAVIYDSQARHGGGGIGISVHSGICAHYILNYGTEEQRQRWLPKMASGELVCAIAMTEPGTGSDLQNVKTTALKDGNEYVVNGQKTFITNGQQADLIIVVAKTDPDAGGKGVSLIMVEADQPGFSRGRNLKKVGLKSQDTSELFFDNVRVPTTNLLGEDEGRGFIQLMQQLPQERLIIALNAATAMEVAVAETVAYTKDRKAFNQTVMDFQNTKFKLAECKTKAVIARSFVNTCMEALLAGELDPTTAAMAKWWTTQMQNEVVDECLQLHGGYGYMWEYPIARMYADGRIQKIFGGTNEIMKELISRTL